VAKTAKKSMTLIDMLQSDQMKSQFALALPSHVKAERFMRICLTAVRKSPKLQRCTAESVMACLMSLSQYGLEPDGRNAHLIPFEDRRNGTVECTLIIDYKGLVELAMRSGLVSTIHADVIYEGDLFEYDLGVITHHIPWFLRKDKEKPPECGQQLGAFAMYKGKDGSFKSEVLSMSELESIRNRSKSKDNGPWVTDPGEMQKKSAFKRLSKWMVLSPEFRDANTDDSISDSLVLDDETLKRLASQIEPHRSPIQKLVESGAAQGEGDVIECDRDESREAHEDPKPSKLAECQNFFKLQSFCKQIGSDPETGSVTWELPNNHKLILTETKMSPPDGFHVVEVTDADCLTQCQNILDKARTTK
jgi:recombination protein RecT